jgi:T4-like virus tail tube protein gp19
MPDLKPISQRQFIITISGCNALWTSIKGGKATIEEITFNSGQNGVELTLPGFIKYDKLTLSKIFNPVSDKEVIKWMNEQRAKPTEFNVAQQPVNADLAGSLYEGAGQILYAGCHLMSFKLPDADRMASGLAMLEIEVSYSAIGYS